MVDELFYFTIYFTVGKDKIFDVTNSNVKNGILKVWRYVEFAVC